MDKGSIIEEMFYNMRDQGLKIDPGKMQLQGDVMRNKCEVLGITRFGL